MSAGLLERLGRGEVLLGDGAMGTELARRGFAIGQCPELLNIVQPDLVGDVTSSYLAAGADLVMTNTFGGSPAALARHGLATRCEELTAAGVALARRAVGERALVVVSCGPTGGLLAPLGPLDPDEVAAGFRRQLAAAAAAGADAICVETMTDLVEARLAVEAAKAVAPQLPVLATMTFDPTPRGFFTIMGVSVAAAVAGLVAAGADVIGSNCGHGVDHMVEVARELARHSDRPLAIRANAGLPERRDGELVYPEGPDEFAARLPDLLGAGVVVVGGCCGTGPAHIRALRARLDALVSSGPDGLR